MRKVCTGILAALSLAVATRADAVVFRVGPAGDYATIQAALTAAAAFPLLPGIPNYHEVRIQPGTYEENLRAPNPCCGGRFIKVTGGWNSAFTGNLIAPARTVVSGRGMARTVNVPWLTSGMLQFHNLTIRDGFVRAGGAHGVGAGAGLQASVGGTAQLGLQWVHLRFNLIRADGVGSAEAHGGGALVLIEGSGRVLIEQSRFEDNALLSSTAMLSAYGGGLNLQVFGGGATIRNTTFLRNLAGGATASGGGGLYALVQDVPGRGLELEDSSFIANGVPLETGEGAGAMIWAGDGGPDATVAVRRIRFLQQASGRTQLQVSAVRGARVDVSDTLVANGRGGVRAFTNEGATHFTNLTIAHNQRRGFDGQSLRGRLSVFNTIAFGNAGGELSVAGDGVTTGFNLVGIDPFFLDPGLNFFGLGGASAAIDAGTNAPPAGLGPRDLARQPRVYNGTVDIGAFEWTP